MRFDDKVAIVAGGAQGIGGAIATALAWEGASVEIWDIDQSLGDEAVNRISRAGGKASFSVVDVLNFDAVVSAVERTTAREGHLDNMVCTVGGGRFVPFLETSGDSFEKEIRLNLLSVYNCARAAAVPMVERNEGRMLFFTSTTGGAPGLAPYGASKAAVESLIRTITAELAATKVGVNSIMPGLTDTGLTRAAFEALDNGEVALQQMSEGEGFGMNTPESVAELALYLLSQEAERVRGTVVRMWGT